MADFAPRSPVVVPDPTVNGHPAHKGYVDSGLAGRAPTVHTHPASAPAAHAGSHHGGSDPVTPAGIGASPSVHTHDYREHNQVPRSATVSSMVTVDGAAAGDALLTCTANTTITVSGTPSGRTLTIDMFASGGARTPVFASTISLTTGVTSRSLAIPSGGVGRAVLRYTPLGTIGWSLDALYLLGT